MIPLAGLVSLIIYILVAGLVFWLLWWLIGYLAVPEPFNKVARCVLAVLAVVFLIVALLSLVNGQPMFR